MPPARRRRRRARPRRKEGNSGDVNKLLRQIVFNAYPGADYDRAIVNRQGSPNMSTAALPLSPRPPESPIPPATLVATAGVGVADRVLVVGRNVIEQVMALAQAGCRSVLSLRADSPHPRHEPAEVVWLSGLADVSERLAVVLRGVSIPRIVVIELAGAEADVRLRPVYRLLRAKGFIRFTAQRTAQGAALVAARPAWLQQVVSP